MLLALLVPGWGAESATQTPFRAHKAAEPGVQPPLLPSSNLPVRLSARLPSPPAPRRASQPAATVAATVRRVDLASSPQEPTVQPGSCSGGAWCAARVPTEDSALPRLPRAEIGAAG